MEKAAKVIREATRRKLPRKRAGITHEASVGGQRLFLRTGEYPDGSLGEIFVDIHKEGAAYRSMMNAFAISVSLGLQYGVPLRKFVSMFSGMRFEPMGKTDDSRIPMATSTLDYVFKLLGLEYGGRDE